MERILKDSKGEIAGVLDLTLTEWADEICQGSPPSLILLIFPRSNRLVFFSSIGEMSAGPKRLDQVVSSGVPVVLAPGCVDMANYSNLKRVPEVFKSVEPVVVGGERGGSVKEGGLGEGGGRVFLEWNSIVTLMFFFLSFSLLLDFNCAHLYIYSSRRTNAEENKKIGEIIAQKVNKTKGPTAFIFPEKGFSILGGENGPFCDFDTDKVRG